MLAASVCGLGLHISVMKFVAERPGDRAVARGASRWVTGVGLLSGVAGAVLLLASANLIGTKVFGEPSLAGVVAALCLSLPFLNLLNISNGISRGLGRVGNQVLSQSVLLPMIWAGLSAGAWLLQMQVTAFAVVQTVSVAACALFAYLLMRGLIGSGKTVLPPGARGSLFSIGLTLFLSGLANYLWLWMDNVMLGLFWTTQEVGLYALPFQFSYMLTLVMVAIASLFSPSVARLAAAQDFAQLGPLYAEVSLACFYVNLAPAVTLFVSSDVFLSLFGPAFVTPQSVLALRVLAASFLLYSLLGAMSTEMLGMSGHHRTSMQIEGAMVLIALVLHLVLTRNWGVAGAALATGSALLIVSALRLVAVWHKLGLRLPIVSFWRGLLALGGTLAAGWGLQGVLHNFNPWVLLGGVLLGVAVVEFAVLVFLRDPVIRSAVQALWSGGPLSERIGA